MEFYLGVGHLVLLRKSVLIPNGMEFYQKLAKAQMREGVVLIPNGMEFYALRLFNFSLFMLSFNSQRDGILLFRGASTPLLVSVLIPNGIEFYGWMMRYLQTTNTVLIPNGMEFYQSPWSPALMGVVSFNSQRDGILRAWAICC